MEIPVIPFRILALAQLAPVPDAGYRPALIEVDLSSLDDALASIGPRFYLSLAKELCPAGGITLEIRSMKDFKPDRLIKNTPWLSRLAEARKAIDDAAFDRLSTQDLIAKLKRDFGDIPLRYEEAPAAPEKSAAQVDDILAMVAMPEGSAGSGGAAAGKGLKEQTDGLLNGVMAAIYESDDFRMYEAAWRGVETLLKQSPVKEGGPVRLEIASIHPEVMAEALEALSVRLAEEPPNLVLLDLPFDNTNRNIDLMERVIEWADHLLAPTITWLTASFFHLEDWSGLGKIPYISHYLENAAYAKWRNLKELTGANWTSATCNRFRVRVPYGEANPAKGTSFQESKQPFVSPVWAVGALTAQSVWQYGWPSRFTDYNHLALTDLPLGDTGEDGPSVAEARLSDDRLLEFIDAGIMPCLGPLRKDRVIVPQEITLAGGSLKYQLFISRVLQFLFWCKANLEQDFAGGDLADNLTRAFGMYWERTGHPAPDDLSISAGSPGEGGLIPLSIRMTPPRAVLPSGQELELGFAW